MFINIFFGPLPKTRAAWRRYEAAYAAYAFKPPQPAHLHTCTLAIFAHLETLHTCTPAHRQISKFYRARCLVYRRRFLQVNIRWKGLDEIYKMYMLLHRSDLEIPKKLIKFNKI